MKNEVQLLTLVGLNMLQTYFMRNKAEWQLLYSKGIKFLRKELKLKTPQVKELVMNVRYTRKLQWE